MKLTATPEREAYKPPDGSHIPDVSELKGTVGYIEHAIRNRQFAKALAAMDELTDGEVFAIWKAPSKGGPFSQVVWNSLARGEFRVWAAKKRRER